MGGEGNSSESESDWDTTVDFPTPRHATTGDNAAHDSDNDDFPAQPTSKTRASLSGRLSVMLVLVLKQFKLPILRLFLIHMTMSIVRIYVISRAYRAGWPSVCPSVRLFCVATIFSIGLYTQMDQPIFFVPAMLIGTIRKAKPVGFIFSRTFHLIRMKFVVMKQFKFSILRLSLSKIYENKENNCYFTDCVKRTLTLICIRTFMNQFDSNLV